MSKFRNIVMLFLITAMLFSLSACGAFAESKTVPVESQFEFLSKQFSSVCQQQEHSSPWYYAVTDFDHNGQLELIAASAQNYDTDVLVWEVSSDCKALNKCSFMLSSEESFPDLLTDSADTFYDSSSNQWYYLFCDAVNTENTYNQKKCSISLLGGNFIYQLYATESCEQKDNLLIITFKDAKGNEISPDEFSSAGFSSFSNMQRSSTSFGWFKPTAADVNGLSDSYAVFIGEKAPSEPSVIHEFDEAPPEIPTAPAEAPETEATVADADNSSGIVNVQPTDPEIVYIDPDSHTVLKEQTDPVSVQPNGNIVYVEPEQSQSNIIYINPIEITPAPVPVPVPAPKPTPFVPMTITRNPTNEARRVGDTARFVACASTFNSLTWTFVDPSGNNVSVQSFCNRFPGSSVDSSSTTLYIYNVSADMGGWGAFCTFHCNDGQEQSTSTAYINMK